jgi:glutamate/tyrosine decarboxylase-like PLP-dependent enzyme
MGALPESGLGWNALADILSERRQGDADWQNGRTALFIFNAGEEVRRVGEQAYLAYMAENALGLRAFPSLTSMEQDIVAIAHDLTHAPEGAAGGFTTGGTDSITMAVKACRDRAIAAGMDTVGAEIIVPQTAHPAFNKAAHLMNLRVIRVPVRDDFTADPAAMATEITERTIMMVGSAPCFPYGLVDPIPEIASIAADADIWCHVDACVGGYFLPFAEQIGVSVPEWDFRLPGVCSISADLHKYGYAPKGASTVLYRTEALYAHQPFSFDVWPSGPMTTPTLHGTRPGGAIAGAWAVLHHLGHAGFRETTRKVIAAREAIEAGAATLGFYPVGTPLLGLTALTHPTKDVMAIADSMAGRGWVSSRTGTPPGIHLMLSPAHLGFTADYLADLTEATALAGDRSGPDTSGQYA